MTTEQKIIRAKVGLLELAKQLSNVSQAAWPSIAHRFRSDMPSAAARFRHGWRLASPRAKSNQSNREHQHA